MKSDLENDSKYINIDDTKIKWYFNDEEIRVSKEDMQNIRPLSIAYSRSVWEHYISSRNHHFMLLDNDDKLVLLEKSAYNWLDDWNKGTYKNLREYLKNNLSYNCYDTIIVFWSKESAVESNWNIFLNNWANFLFDDEGVILINTTNENVLVFCSDGVLLKGKRISKV